jgi:hypothetical protein
MRFKKITVFSARVGPRSGTFLFTRDPIFFCFRNKKFILSLQKPEGLRSAYQQAGG